MISREQVHDFVRKWRETECVEFKRQDIYSPGNGKFFADVAAICNAGESLSQPRCMIVGVNDPRPGERNRGSKTFDPLGDPKVIYSRNESLATTSDEKLSQCPIIRYQEILLPSPFNFPVGVYDIVPNQRPVFTCGGWTDYDSILWTRSGRERPRRRIATPAEQNQLWAEAMARNRERTIHASELNRIRKSIEMARKGGQNALQTLLPSLGSGSATLREEIVKSLPRLLPDYSAWAPWVSGLALWDFDPYVREACAEALMRLVPDRRVVNILLWMSLSQDENPGLRIAIVQYLERQPGVDITTLRFILTELAGQEDDYDVSACAGEKLAGPPYCDEVARQAI